jgi:hypoxanthine phosphoribosyltransferase
VLERAEDGTVLEAFTPDFYLPEQDMYVECTTMRQKLTNRKNRKLRKLREQGVLVTVLYRRDFERLRARHGFPFEIAA